MKHLSRNISKDDGTGSKLPVKPVTIHTELDGKLAGLEDAKRFISTRLALHMRRAVELSAGKSNPDKPQCILLLGPSGSGKTFLMENAARVVKLPFMNVNSAALTEEGFVGLGVTDIFRSFLKSSPTPKLNPYAICFFDEWDKRVQDRNQEKSYSRGVQSEMLRLMEGTVMEIEDHKRIPSGKPNLKFDTRGLMFVFAGAFEGLMDTTESQRVSGFAPLAESTVSTARNLQLRDQLVAYGMLPEFLNRITGIVTFPTPTPEDMLAMIRFRNGPLALCNKSLQGLGTELVMRDETALALARYACESHTYCRGMHSILKAACDHLVYDSISGQIEIETEDLQSLIAGKRVTVCPKALQGTTLAA
jgi:ATP-dependent Clp protease ATP-binding subunit ClpX